MIISARVEKEEVPRLRRRRRKIRKPFFTKKRITIFSVSLVVIIAVSAFMIGMGGMFSGYDNVDEIVKVEKGSGKVNFLLVGLDKGASLTDTIMVASYDLDNSKINILSIPRDTRMYVGTRYQKINSAYSISKDGKKKGINGTIEAVSRLTRIPINYYIEFTLTAFRDTIDALGGVEFDVPQDMHYDDDVQGLNIHLKKGYQLLDGKKAEQLIRFRSYPMGDIDRVKVQQGFIKALAEQKLNLGIIENIPELFKTIGDNIKTNLNAGDVAKYALSMSEIVPGDVNLYEVPGMPNSSDYGASYWIPDMTALKGMINETFGYDASGATIHSADGKSISKDVKSPTVETSQAPASTDASKQAATPQATKAPVVTEEVENDVENTSENVTTESIESENEPDNTEPIQETAEPASAKADEIVENNV